MIQVLEIIGITLFMLVAIIIIIFVVFCLVASIISMSNSPDGYCIILEDRCKHPDIICEDCIVARRAGMNGMICPLCGGQMDEVGYEQGYKCDTCGFKYDGLGNPDKSEMEDHSEDIV